MTATCIEDDIMDAHYGMISRAQAASILESAPRPAREGSDSTDAASLSEFLSAHKTEMQSDYVVNVQDRVYRIFNPVMRGQEQYRTVVLGSENRTMRALLSGKLSESVDAGGICRGDVVLIKGATLDVASQVLRSGKGASIAKVSSSSVAVTDFSSLREGQKNVDIEGRVLEIGPIRQVARLGEQGSIAVSDCVLGDGNSQIRVSMWGSSASATTSMRINGVLRIEFCSVRERNGSLEVYANDLSRVMQRK